MNIKDLFNSKLSDYKLSKLKMPPLKISDSVARLPIVQGGMGVGISLSGLASAVANEGGIGVIAANAIGMLEPDYLTNGKEANKRALRKEIRKARSLSSGIIGVNIMVAVNDFHDLLRVAIEEKVDMAFLGAGLPLKGIPAQDLVEAGVKVVPIVSSGRAARLIFSYWAKQYNIIPDAVVVEGPKAGGHLGFKAEQIDSPAFTLEQILPPVVKEIKVFEEKFNKEIPVIAAGGIFTGEDIFEIFKLGASGVQMATRFVATDECDADNRFKESYVKCTEKDIMIIKSPVGLPGRAIRNSFLTSLEDGTQKKFRCPWRCLESCNAGKAKYCISQALDSARKGELEGGFAFAGANAYRVDEILPVSTLVKELKKEYLEIVERNTVNLRQQVEESLEELIRIRDEYFEKAKASARSLKADLDELLEGHTAAVRAEYGKALVKLDTLKAEYAVHFKEFDKLKKQLSTYFDTSSLKLPTLGTT